MRKFPNTLDFCTTRTSLRTGPFGPWPAISAVFGCLALVTVFGDAGAPADAVIQALPHGFFSSFGYFSHDKLAALPNSLLTITLASNFGTFLLYGLSCIICMVAYHNHPKFKVVRHLLIPVFGVVGQSGLHGFLPGRPVHGLSAPRWNPCSALGIALVWAIFGGIYFVRSSKETRR